MLEIVHFGAMQLSRHNRARIEKSCDRRPGGIEPLSLSAPTGLKPAPNTSQAQFGIEPVTHRLNP